jgi:HD-like signal output (HDOD) protein
MIAADVLKLARSPLYAARQEARTLKEAALRLGISGVQSVVLETLQRVIFRSATMGPALDAVRRHSSAVAHAARLVARHTSVDAEFAFLCGLFHDLGHSAGLMALGESTAALDPAQWSVLEQTHERAAGLLSKLWKLPPELQLVLANHHALAKELPLQHPAVSVIVLAEHFAHEHGGGLGPLLEKARLKLNLELERVEPARVGAARQVLRVNDAVFAHLHKDVGTALEHLAQQG